VSIRLLLAAAIAVLPAPLLAQAAAYRRDPADTVRLREITTGETVVRTPQGDVPLGSRQQSLIAVTFLPGDSARAWYEDLDLEASSPRIVEHPPTGSVLRQPFALRFDSRGRVQTLATPAFPPALGRIADLRHQFDDYFLRLPAAPLAPGLTWADTVTRRDSTAAGSYSRTTGAAQYRVERDTTVGGVRGVVVSVRQRLRLENGGPIEGQGITAASVMEGTDEGLWVFAPAEGRILGRAHSGDLSGTVVLRGGVAPVTMPQTYRYSSTLEPARGGVVREADAAASAAASLARFAPPAVRLAPECELAGPAAPVTLTPTTAAAWRDAYGVLVPWFGRDGMPLPADIVRVSSAAYGARGTGREAVRVVAVQFRDAAAAEAAARGVRAHLAAEPRRAVARRASTMVLTDSAPGVPAGCYRRVRGLVEQELGR
jgi:hypothetical protein